MGVLLLRFTQIYLAERVKWQLNYVNTSKRCAQTVRRNIRSTIHDTKCISQYETSQQHLFIYLFIAHYSYGAFRLRRGKINYTDETYPPFLFFVIDNNNNYNKSMFFKWVLISQLWWFCSCERVSLVFFRVVPTRWVCFLVSIVSQIFSFHVQVSVLSCVRPNVYVCCVQKLFKSLNTSCYIHLFIYYLFYLFMSHYSCGAFRLRRGGLNKYM